jgi:hypothetical protein
MLVGLVCQEAIGHEECCRSVCSPPLKLRGVHEAKLLVGLEKLVI